MPRPSLALPVLVAGLLAGGEAMAQNSTSPQITVTCDTLEVCLAMVRDPGQRIEGIDSDVGARLVQFGEPAVDALVPLLSDPDTSVRVKAGSVLSGFRKIDPGHFAALAAAWPPGPTRAREDRWIPRALAATGTDEAVRLLWQDYVRFPHPRSNLQVFLALADLGADRIRPLVVERFAECRASTTGAECEGLYQLLYTLDRSFPPWSIAEIVRLAQEARFEGARESAETELIRLGHDAGREPSARRLAALSAEQEPRNAYRARLLIRDVVKYGAQSRESGPDIVPYLDPRFDPDVRTEAALALGAIDARSAIPALMALAGGFEDDWVLAYNTVESLGRLRATEARDLVRRTAETHWHRGVRNNAQRALSAIDGGAFAGPGMSEEEPPYPGSPGDPDRQPFYIGPLRWIGDDAARYCDMPGELLQVGADTSGPLQFPQAGSVVLRFEPPSPARQAAVRERIPTTEAPGQVVAIRPLPSGELVAFAAGEFGGGVFYRPDNGPTQVLLREPVAAMWQMGGRIYVAAGLTHMMSNYGHLYVIDPAGPRVERTVRLPANPGNLLTLTEGVVVLRTSGGDIGLREDGSLLDPSTLERCAGDS